MTSKQFLQACLLIIRRGWTTGCLARLATGQPVEATHPAACCWCADGAILKVAATHTQRGSVVHDAYRYLREAIDGDFVLPTHSDGMRIVGYNDQLQDQAAAVAWFERAIALAP